VNVGAVTIANAANVTVSTAQAAVAQGTAVDGVTLTGVAGDMTGAGTVTVAASTGDDLSTNLTAIGIGAITLTSGQTYTVSAEQASIATVDVGALGVLTGVTVTVKDIAADIVDADGTNLLASITGSVNVQITDQAILAQLKAINDATSGAITLDDSTAALSGSAADLVAALTGITGYTGNITVTDQATLAQLVTINDAVDGTITLDVTSQALSGSSADMAAAFAGITDGYVGNLTVSGTLTNAAGVTVVNTVSAATTGKASATLQATSTEFASLASSATDEVVITVTDGAAAAVDATTLSGMGGKTASVVTVTNAIVVSGTLAEATAAFVTADTLVLAVNAVVRLDDVAGSSIAAVNLNTLAGVVASVEVSSGAVLTGAQADVTTALTTDTVTYPNSDYDVSITGAFGIDASLINMYNAVASSTSGDLIVTGTSFGDTLNASSFTGDGSKGLTLNGGSGADVITGTGFADIITGGNGTDVITAGAGSDTITGGAGSDTFVFNSVSGADTIADYTVADDSIQLSKAIFTGLGDIGALSSDEFVSGAGLTAAADGTDRIVYDTTSGALYYDADGAGGDAAVQIATFTGLPGLLSSEFAIIA
jgi:Ca2+-binding RTX toxin-like protein